MSRLFAALLLLPLTTAYAEPTTSLIPGDPERGQEKAQACAACHGVDGNSSNPAWPKLAGQHYDYIVSQLKAFKSGARDNAVMSPQAAKLSEQDMHDLAAWFSQQKMTLEAASESAVATAETLYRAGKSSAGMPACIACHGPNGNGMPGVGYPKIGGQYAQYTAAQLRAYRAGERNSTKADIMQSIAKHLSDAEIEALAEYVSGLH